MVEKTAELLEEVDARTHSNNPQAAVQQQQPQQYQQQVLLDSRAQSLHLCGHDIEGVSIAGQVYIRCTSALQLLYATNMGSTRARLGSQDSVFMWVCTCRRHVSFYQDAKWPLT